MAELKSGPVAPPRLVELRNELWKLNDGDLGAGHYPWRPKGRPKGKLNRAPETKLIAGRALELEQEGRVSWRCH